MSDTSGFQGRDVRLSVATPGVIPFKPGFHPGHFGRKAGRNHAKQAVKSGIRAMVKGVVGRNSPFLAHKEAIGSNIWWKSSS